MMKYLFVVILFVVTISCNPNNNDEGQIVIGEDKEEGELAVGTEGMHMPQGVASPGYVVFEAKIVKNYNSGKSICNVSKENVSLIEIVEIVKSGMGIVSMPIKKQQLLVSFLSKSEEIVVGTILKANAKESLCSEASKTYFTINSYEILE